MEPFELKSNGWDPQEGHGAGRGSRGEPRGPATAELAALQKHSRDYYAPQTDLVAEDSTAGGAEAAPAILHMLCLFLIKCRVPDQISQIHSRFH